MNKKRIKDWKRHKKGYVNSTLGSCSPKLARRLAKTASQLAFCAKPSDSTDELNSVYKLEVNTDRSAAVKVHCQTEETKQKAVSNSASLSNVIPTNAYQTSKPPFLLQPIH